ncbi:MAG: ExeA family protein [Thermodesulfovibrionales bacterium]
MYREFYNLKEKPFSLTPDPYFLFLSEYHRTALESLLYGIHHRAGFMVVTGEIGTGKTTICRALLERLDRDIKTAVIFNPLLSEKELIESIIQDFGYTPDGKSMKELIDTLNRFLVQRFSKGENTVLIIDEAQNLPIPTLEQIRMLSNLETEKEKLLQIILFGQLEFEQMLKFPLLKQLNQRISIRLRLEPFNRTETESYIYQRLILAGSRGNITFSRSAIDRIQKFSNGIPRLINLLCDRALMAGFVEQTYRINRRITRRAEKSLAGKDVNSFNPRLLNLMNRIVPLPVTILIFLLIFFTLGILSSRTMQNQIKDGIRETYFYIFDKGGRSVSEITDILNMENLEDHHGKSR